jgi:hypothetical protein
LAGTSDEPTVLQVGKKKRDNFRILDITGNQD